MNGYWQIVKDGDARAYELMTRHYSFRAYTDGRRERAGYRNRRLFVGPGQKLVLLSADGDALFVWRVFIDRSGQDGVNCAVFRNESGRRASDLIRMAEAMAWERWPGRRLYTYVDSRKVQGSVPGYCFRRAGWRHVGYTKKLGLLIFEKVPKQ